MHSLICIFFAAFFAILNSCGRAEDSNLGITVLHLPKNCARKSIVGDIISVVYLVTLSDGTVVEDLRGDDEPFEFRLGSKQAITGLDLGLRDVCVGQKLRLRVPSRLAHGSKGFESLVPANATLVYELEVKRIRKYFNLFDEIDTNRNSFLSKDEFGRYLMMREREIRDVPDANNNFDSEEEFDPDDTTWMYEDDVDENVEVDGMLEEIFKTIDENGDGLISEDEFFRKNVDDLKGLDFEMKDPRKSIKKAGKKSGDPRRTAQNIDEPNAKADASVTADKATEAASGTDENVNADATDSAPQQKQEL